MPKNAQWVVARIAEARKHHASVTDAVSARVEKLLSGHLSNRPFSPGELTDIAKALISDMIPVPAKAER